MTTANFQQDIAALCALSVLQGDTPAPELIRVMEAFGYWKDGRLTDEGRNAAADASGFQED